MVIMSVTGNANEPGGAPLSGQIAATTGRWVVVFADDVHPDEAAMVETVRSVAGVNSVASTSDFTASALDVAQVAADATVFAELGLAVIDADPAFQASMQATAAADPRIIAVEPELVHHAIHDSLSADYLRGYRDAAANLYQQATPGAAAPDAEAERVLLADTADLTWGLIATLVPTSTCDGSGVAVAVLDTGFDLGHPDFSGRPVVAQSFVAGEAPQDGHGHGTHCVGTSCGPAARPTRRRYGIAGGADLHVGKVLSNQGSGTDRNILAGMSWAIASGCKVISMSLGADVRTVSVAYNAAGRRALAAGTLIVAAAGNHASRRFGNYGFVGVPANSPSIMAVAAIDARMNIGDFSARSNPVTGGNVDIAGPGVDVYSSWLMPQRYNTISGTSMATPHVAGIAALWSQSTGDTGQALWSTVLRSAKRLSIPSIDAGVGLAQAPQ
jgi:subtilisin